MIVQFTATDLVFEDQNVPSNCNSITFINQGENTVYIDGLRLEPGATWKSSAPDRDTIEATNYKVEFVGSGPSRLVVQRCRIEKR